MPTSDYKIDGIRVPGVTTIIGRFKESGALMHWAWEQGRQGKNYRETAEGAASVGTIAHAMVESDLKSLRFDASKYPDQQLSLARGAYDAYRTWKKQSKLRVVSVETPFISTAYRYGGTPDAIISIGGKLAVGDIKTANGIYRDNLIQVAAYKNLWEEKYPDQPITGGFHILRFSKENGDFSHHYYPSLDDAWEMFKHLRAAYDLDKELKKRAL